MALGTIIGIILVAIIAGCIAILAIPALKPKKRGYQSTSGDDKATKKRSIIAGIVAGVAVLAVVIVPPSFHTVEAGEIAVVKRLGKITNTRTAGTYFDFWMINNYDVYDAKVQQLNIQTEAYTTDSQQMDISLTVQFQIQQHNVKEIATNYGKLELLANRIEAVSTERTKSVLSQYKAETLIVERANVSPMVEQSIREAISDKFFVDFNAAVLTDISFSDAFEKAVEDKMTAEQEKLKAEYENEKKIAQATAELEIAKKAAEAKIREAEGQAESQRLLAKASADEVKIKSVETARMLGFTINEVETTDGTEYEIDFTGKTAEEIALISDYLKYVAYLEAWDGKLPQTVVTDGSAQLLIPTAPSLGENQNTTSPSTPSTDASQDVAPDGE